MKTMLLHIESFEKHNRHTHFHIGKEFQAYLLHNVGGDRDTTN
jgi:hypothetical protein